MVEMKRLEGCRIRYGGDIDAGVLLQPVVADPRVRDVVQAALDLATCVEAVERRRLRERSEEDFEISGGGPWKIVKAWTASKASSAPAPEVVPNVIESGGSCSSAHRSTRSTTFASDSPRFSR